MQHAVYNGLNITSQRHVPIQINSSQARKQPHLFIICNHTHITQGVFRIWYLGVPSTGRCSGLGRPRVSWRVVLHENTVKATFNTPCELLRGLSGQNPRGVVRELGVLTPAEGVENSHVIIQVTDHLSGHFFNSCADVSRLREMKSVRL